MSAASLLRRALQRQSPQVPDQKYRTVTQWMLTWQFSGALIQQHGELQLEDPIRHRHGMLLAGWPGEEERTQMLQKSLDCKSNPR